MHRHGLEFYIEGATITVDDMGAYLASHLFDCSSEHQMEILAHDIAHELMVCVGKKVSVARIESDRKDWMKRHPPNHAGYYYCHLCGGWVHESQAELDHIEPKSVLRGEDPNRDDNRRMAHTWPIMAPDGKELCPGNRGKGSRSIPSVTLEIAPPDWEI